MPQKIERASFIESHLPSSPSSVAPALQSTAMAVPSQAAARCCRHILRPSSVRISSTYLAQSRRTPARRWQSTQADAPAAAPTNPKIAQIVDQISQLTLLETADLVASLKVGRCCWFLLAIGPCRIFSCRESRGIKKRSSLAPTLSLSSIYPALNSKFDYILLTFFFLLQSRLNIPDLPVGGFAVAPGAGQPAGGAAPAAAAEAEEESAPAAQEKTLFNIKLESYDAAAKPKIIKEIKSMLGLSLVDSKKFVESVPKVLKESVPKEEAEKIVETLKGLGAKATME